MPEILLKIKAFLQSAGINFSRDFDDGRVNSALNEKGIVDKLLAEFSEFVSSPPKKRYWWDFAVKENGILLPVNIKISEMGNAADNLNCKLGIYYALTGRVPNFHNEISWGDFFSILKQGIQENNCDYYFLVVNKQDTKDIILTGLKEIRKLQPNGNNLPFQCQWGYNRSPHKRNFTEARDFILNTMGESIQQRARIRDEFCHFFPEHLSN